MVRVLVVDGQPLVREGLRTAMTATPWIEVAGEAGDGVTAVQRADALRPDVVVLDLDLPDRDGVDVTREIVLRRPGIAVLVLTVAQRDDAVFAAMRAGARGGLQKAADGEQIVRAIETVAQGEVILGADLAARVISWFAAGGDRPLAPFPELTDREREILDLAARGLPTPAIAQRLFLPEEVLHGHVANVFMKLQFADRSATLARARDAAQDSGAE
jgi:DNA-binding NarL/FixJ family response regulator